MTRRERVVKALNFEQPDVCPWHIGMTIPLREKVAKHYGTNDLADVLGNHLAGASHEPADAWREVRPGFWRDEFGVVRDRTIDQDIGNPCEYVINDPSDLARFEWPHPASKERVANYEAFFSRRQDRFTLGDVGFSLFERAWTMRGMERLYMDMLDRPRFVHEFLDAICDWNIQAVDKMLEYPFDAIEFGDDWGSQRGLLMGPALWREFVKPRIARMYKRVRDAGRYVFIHSCGDVDELFDELVELGLNVFNPFQPEVMDTFALARKYKGKLAFFGGISTQRLLPYATPGEVASEVKRIVGGIGAGGGYIAAPAHATPKDVPLENFLAMIEVLQNQ